MLIAVVLVLGGVWRAWSAAQGESARLVGAPYFGSGKDKTSAFSTASTKETDAVSSSSGMDSTTVVTTTSQPIPPVPAAPTRQPTKPPITTRPPRPTETTEALQPVAPSISYSQYMEETYFIGDSRTNRMVMYGYVARSRAFALNGINHSDACTRRFVDLGDGRLLSMAEAVAQVKPVRMVVSLGINGLSFMSESGFMNTYEEFLNGLRQASPDTILVVQAILPVSAAYESKDPRMTNEKIDRYNEKLRTITQACGGRFLDTSAVLKDENGDLAARFDSGDGLHYNKTAYKVLFGYIEEHLELAL